MSLFVPLSLEEVGLRLTLAVLAGVLLGIDREIRGKPAGLRTHILVALSSAVTALVSVEIFQSLAREGLAERTDLLRVIQGLAQAIGFIAAGVIIHGQGDALNVTTAANVWLASVIGFCCGIGSYLIAGMALALGLVVLVGLRAIEHRIFRRR